MKLAEFESKNIFLKYSISIPRGKVVNRPDDAAVAVGEIGKAVFVKAQIPVAGRGKEGGILLASSPQEAYIISVNLLGKEIKGYRVKTLLIEEKLDIERQYYASVTVDRKAKSYAFLASAAGGVDIEETAATHPEKIIKMIIDPVAGFNEAVVVDIVNNLKMNETDAVVFARHLAILYKIAMDCDAELVEINPLVKTSSGQFIAADAKITIDDNAVFRHPEFTERNLQREEDTPREAEARKQKFSYVDLDGDIGIVGNGAGLVMATVDMVNVFGGKPANFLDIGGGAQVEVIKNGVLLVISKPEVRGVLINILGGITRCDMVARGVVEGLAATSLKKPVAVRMMGTNEEEGKAILREAGIESFPDMEQATEAIVKAAKCIEHTN